MNEAADPVCDSPFTPVTKNLLRTFFLKSLLPVTINHKSPLICSEVVMKPTLVGSGQRTWLHSGYGAYTGAGRRQRSAADSWFTKPTIGQSESRCPWSCQSDAAPLFPRAAARRACQSNCYMRQIVPFIPTPFGGRVGGGIRCRFRWPRSGGRISAEENRDMVSGEHWERFIEKGRHWLSGW